MRWQQGARIPSSMHLSPQACMHDVQICIHAYVLARCFALLTGAILLNNLHILLAQVREGERGAGARRVVHAHGEHLAHRALRQQRAEQGLGGSEGGGLVLLACAGGAAISSPAGLCVKAFRKWGAARGCRWWAARQTDRQTASQTNNPAPTSAGLLVARLSSSAPEMNQPGPAGAQSATTSPAGFAILMKSAGAASTPSSRRRRKDSRGWQVASPAVHAEEQTCGGWL